MNVCPLIHEVCDDALLGSVPKCHNLFTETVNKGSDESTIILALRFQTVADLSNSEETTAERRFILQRAYNEKLTAAVSLSREIGSVEFFCGGDPPLVEIDTTE